MSFVVEVVGTLPERKHAIDAGADLRSAVDVVIPSGQRALVATNTRLKIPAGAVGYVCPRSGLAAKHGVTVLNAPGVVDAGYTGEIYVNLFNHGGADFEIKAGDRIAQLVVQPVSLVTFAAVNELGDEISARGDDGHGSTGV